eukprot:TRINITY_DN1674_c0_g1_i4.p3 TRINITY_DN1674_c0_g1~~TRINITY_DN1674_c0_g1_i4.p3  ORF type:complete len:178 (-),score=30.25 TRINITY_DN1674_c0_g1_i4:284-817(-)
MASDNSTSSSYGEQTTKSGSVPSMSSAQEMVSRNQQPTSSVTQSELETQQIKQKQDDAGNEPQKNLSEKQQDQGGQEEEEEEEDKESCGFCRWMKAGGCKVEFTAWEDCVDEARKNSSDFTKDCSVMTQALHQCMENNRDYYEPLLEAEELAKTEDIEEEERKKLADNDNDAQGNNQ